MEPKPKGLFLGSDPVWAWLVASYCYYIKSHPIMPDHKFDELCLYLQRNWYHLTSEFMPLLHANGFNSANCVAATGFGELEEKYPRVIRMIYGQVGETQKPKKKPVKKPVVIEEAEEDNGLDDMFF